MSEPSLNPLLSKVKLPGRVFQFPSKGIFYEPGVLAESVKDGEIHVKPMSALTELKVRSADLLLSTKIIREVCGECAPEILKPELLLAKDVDALFLFLVASTYGNKKTIRSIHGCKEAEFHDYEIDLEPVLANPRNGMLEHRDVVFSVELNNGQTVKLRPVTFMDAIEMMLARQRIVEKEMNAPQTITNKDSEEVMIRDLLSVIKSVSTGEPDNISVQDPSKIAEWVHLISRKQVDQIVEAATKSADWGFKFDVTLKCKDCGETYTHDMELNPVNFLSG